eukprot:scaffold10902_cov90-Skeletonema_dohrnii-CCMP3373.AAC.1
MRRRQQRSVEMFAYVEPAIGKSDRSTLIVADRVTAPHNIMRYRLDESDTTRQTGTVSMIYPTHLVLTVSMIYPAYNVETQDECQMNAPDKLRYTRLSIETIEPSESR